MTLWSPRAPRHLAAALLLGALGSTGCGQKEPPAAAPEAKAPAASEARPEGKPEVKPPAPPARDRLHQAFAEATRDGDNPPVGALKPPDETASSKPVFRLLEDVTRLWDQVRFTTPAGKKIAYTAVIATSEGEVRIELLPELAPNHVRNFICLARAGYYDELFFDRCRHEEINGQALQALEGGCPLGSGDSITGSIGYWLKDELVPADKATHEAGAVGACRGEEADSAATRFYITLDKAPFLDGNFTLFGKVVQGLDVVRRIYAQPVVAEDKERDGARRPEKPVVIRKVTVLAKELEPTSK
jgi:cyclophilin family peptidyl-prolyl cis-trans isomerase